jgi:hypothetical protein
MAHAWSQVLVIPGMAGAAAVIIDKTSFSVELVDNCF